MKLDVKVTNLGRFEQGTIKVRPITVLTGPNGTGKSFFTKTLYSLLNVVNRNTYHLVTSDIITEIELILKTFGDTVADHDKQVFLQNGLHKIQSELNVAERWGINKYLEFTVTQVEPAEHLLAAFKQYFSMEINENQSGEQSRPISDFEKLISRLRDSEFLFLQELSQNFFNELADNFQIIDITELVTFSKKSAGVVIDGTTSLHFGKGENEGNIKADFMMLPRFIDEVSSLSTVVFFESPAYWKIKDALQTARQSSRANALGGQNPDDILTGVPKYFYDLDQALKTKIKSKGSSEIRDLATSLKDELGGEFVFSGDNLVFKDSKSGREISKNLVSFGMTNLGMIHTLLKNNVITKGSFVFIDEPETNLHPDWQVLLMNTLIKLAEHEVNVVIATHSMDMLKALEMGMKKRKDQSDDDFMAIHFLATDGQLLEFDSVQPMAQLAEARSALNSTYESLYFEDFAND